MNGLFIPYEIFVVDQSDNDLTKQVISEFIKNNKNMASVIRYEKNSDRGKSKALNFALSKVSGDIISFTDDDCIPDKNWLLRVNIFFWYLVNTFCAE